MGLWARTIGNVTGFAEKLDNWEVNALMHKPDTLSPDRQNYFAFAFLPHLNYVFYFLRWPHFDHAFYHVVIFVINTIARWSCPLLRNVYEEERARAVHGHHPNPVYRSSGIWLVPNALSLSDQDYPFVAARLSPHQYALVGCIKQWQP